MKARSVAQFAANFPDDDFIEEDGEIIQFPGKNISNALVQGLNAHGFSTTEPEHEGPYGWTFYATKDKVRLWLKVQQVDPSENYLNCNINVPFGFRRKCKEVHLEARKVLSACMKHDARFSNLLWHTERIPPGEIGWSEPDRP